MIVLNLHSEGAHLSLQSFSRPKVRRHYNENRVFRKEFLVFILAGGIIAPTPHLSPVRIVFDEYVFP